MNKKTKSIALLIAAAAMFFASANAYPGVTSASNSKDGSNHESYNNYSPLLNCLSSEGTDGDIKWFEPLGCSLDSSNGDTHGLKGTDTQGTNNADVSVINYNADVADNGYTNELYGHTFEDPYEVGWN